MENYRHHGYADVSAVTAPIFTTTLLVIAIALVICGVIGAFIISSITRPLKQLATVAEQVGDGDLRNFIEMNTNDEYGKLASIFNKMISSLREVVRDVSEKSTANFIVGTAYNKHRRK